MIFLENKDFERIYLFGSFARGTQRIDSDIDIAIITKKELDVSLWQQKFENKGIKVEFHTFKELKKTNSLDKNVLEEGMLLMQIKQLSFNTIININYLIYNAIPFKFW